VLLDGFDLVVVGAVILVLDRHDRLDRHDDRRYDDRHHHRLPGPAVAVGGVIPKTLSSSTRNPPRRYPH
jgi:hypothetical protein